VILGGGAWFVWGIAVELEPSVGRKIKKRCRTEGCVRLVGVGGLGGWLAMSRDLPRTSPSGRAPRGLMWTMTTWKTRKSPSMRLCRFFCALETRLQTELPGLLRLFQASIGVFLRVENEMQWKVAGRDEGR
jgi:hypothetical protein